MNTDVVKLNKAQKKVVALIKRLHKEHTYATIGASIKKPTATVHRWAKKPPMHPDEKIMARLTKLADKEN